MTWLVENEPTLHDRSSKSIL